MRSIIKRWRGGQEDLFVVTIILTIPTILVRGEDILSIENSNQSANTSHNVIPNSVSTWGKNGAEGKFFNEWTAPYEMRKGYPYYLAGHDYEGRPVWILEFGKWNIRKIVDAGEKSMAAFDLYTKQVVHRMTKSFQDLGTLENSVTGITFMLDMEDFSLTQLAHIPTVAYVLKITKTHLSWLIEHALLIITLNTNALAQSLINLSRPIVGTLMERVEIYGTNRAKWQPLLLKHIPRSQLPEFYGGTADFKPLQVYG